MSTVKESGCFFVLWSHLSYYKNRSLAVKPYSQKYYADLVHKPTISNAFVTSF